MPLFDLTDEKTGQLLAGINLDADRRIRPGFIQKYNVTGLGAVECVAVEQLQYASTWPGANTTSVVVAVWSDGSVTMDGAAAVATATLTTARWCKLVQVTVPGWYAAGSAWRPKNVLMLYTDTKVYIFDPKTPTGGVYLYEVQQTAPSIPTAGAPAGGNIPAGTYKFMTTEISAHGTETLLSPAVSVTSGTDFQVVITHVPPVGSTAVRWRLYMSKESDVTSNETYRLVDEVNVATGTITANLKPTQLGRPYDIGRIAVPTTAATGCIHQGVLVSAADSNDTSTVFVSATSIDENGYGLTGFPEVGHVVATYPSAKMLKTVAVASVTGNLLAFTNSNITGIYGDINDGTSVQAREVSTSIGTLNDRTVAVMGDRVFFMNTDCSRAYVSDGFSVQDITEGRHLLDGVWYTLKGSQEMQKFGELQGSFTAPIVIADPMHNKVWFGGEIVATGYESAVSAGSWSAAAKAANPQGNRQYVWKVFDLSTSKWLTWVNIPVKSWCIKDGTIWFGDHDGHLWALHPVNAIDGPAAVGLVTSYLTTMASGTTIQTTVSWNGISVEGAPVVIFNTSTGASQLRYYVSGTSTSITVDLSTVITANDVLFLGCPVADLWTQPMVQPVRMHSVDWYIMPHSVDGQSAAIFMLKTRAGYSTWHRLASWLPCTSSRPRMLSGHFCPAMMLRVLLPAMNSGSPAMQAYYNFTVAGLTLDGTPMPKARW